MKRVQRKVNLKKLLQQNNAIDQNFESSNQMEERRVTRSSKRAATEPSVSVYFSKDNQPVDTCRNLQTIVECSEDKNRNELQNDECTDGPSVVRGKRLNLTRFLFKDKKDIPPHIRKQENDSDDFETPVKKIKKAPKLSQPIPAATKTNKTRKKPATRQLKIESAFLRNEKIFSEITAQHCLAENFNPDDMQLALVISRSEVELCGANSELNATQDENDALNCTRLENGEILSDGENIRAKLQKYGFRTAAKEDYTGCFAAAFLTGQKKRPKTKWANKFTALTLRDASTQAKKLTAKVEALCAVQNKRKQLTVTGNQHQFPPYKIHSANLSKYAEVRPDMQLIRNAEHFNLEQHLEKYFVDDIFPLTKLPAGHLLKKWAVIPGRDLSPERITAAMKLQNQKLQTFYAELENFVSSGKNRENIAEMVVEAAAAMEIETVLPENLKETDTLHERNEQCQAEIFTTQPMQSANPINQDLLTGLCDSIKSLEKCTVATTQARATSPDLFADSESDGEICVTNQLNDISIYETYSTDDEKNSSKVDEKEKENENENKVLSVKADLVIDLTQEDEDAARDDKKMKVSVGIESSVELKNARDFESCNNSLKEFNDDLEAECSVNPQQSNSSCTQAEFDCENDAQLNEFIKFQTEKNLDKFYQHVLCSTPKVVNVASEARQSTISIGNSQSNDEDDDAFVVLSDDEINYSIMRATAATSIHNKSHISADLSEKVITIEEDSSSDSDNSQRTSEDHNFSVLEFIDVQQTFEHDKLLKSTSFDLNEDKEPINLDYLTVNSPVVTPLKRQSFRDSIKESRAEFGILESLSASFSATPTDWKEAPAKTTSTTPIIDSPWTPATRKSIRTSMKTTANSPVVTPLRRQSFRDSIKESRAEFGILESLSASFSATPTDWKEAPTKATSTSPIIDSPSTPLIRKSIDCTSMKKHRAEFGISESLSTSFLEALSDWKETPIKLTPKRRTIRKSTKSVQLDSPNEVLPKHASFDLTTYREYADTDWLPSTSHVVSCLSTPSKRQSIRKSLKEQRAEFGILESQSESLSQLQLDWKDTPRQYNSPLRTPENVGLRRCRSSQKFRSFLYDESKAPRINEPETNLLFNDFDEFDRLVYGSPAKLVETHNIPTGLSQLLTAEINVDPHEDKTKKYTTPVREKTPQKQTKQKTFDEEITVNGHVYSVRVTNSPKPRFAQLPEAELLKQLYNIGVKPLKRDQAVKLLEYIYNETHPILDSKRKSLCAPQQPSSPGKSQNMEMLPSSTCNSQRSESDLITKNALKKFHLQDCFGDVLLRFSTELNAELRNDEEDYIFQTNVTKKTPQPLLPLHVAWYNLVCSCTDLHESILMYEPIDLQEIYIFLKGLGYRYNPKDLKNFFDRRCIIFRYDLKPPEKQKDRHVRQKRK